MIITVTLNPALDKTIYVRNFALGLVSRVEEARLDPGGKGINVSKVIHNLGGRSVAMGIVGGAAGEFIRDQLDQMNIQNDFVFSRAETRTNLKIVDPVLHTCTDINESGAPVTPQLLAEVWEKLSDLVSAGDTVVISGKNPPEMPDNLLSEWITALKQEGVTVALDTVGMPMKIGVAAAPTIIKPNDAELEALCERTFSTREEIVAAARKVIETGVRYVVVSMGEDGALFVSEDEVLHAHGVEVPVSSTVGAGDAMLASVVMYLEQGLSWEKIAINAVAVSAANVMCSGTQAATLADIAPLIERVHVERLL